MRKNIWLLICLLTCVAGSISAQSVEQTVEERLQAFLTAYSTPAAKIGECKLDSFRINHEKRRLEVFVSENFSYQPFRQSTIEDVYTNIKQVLPGPVNYYRLQVYAGKHAIEELIPNYYRTKDKDKTRLLSKLEYKGKPWVTRTSRPYKADKGLEGRHISLWQSHGKYYINKTNEWGWQRPRLFCTTEDQFTQSFVLPYLIPMLENAGAIVFTPRERDIQRYEVIVDNDGNNSLYVEESSRKAQWNTTQIPGFAKTKSVYQDGDNPFNDGSARFTRTEKKKNKAFAEWIPEIPETGNYAVYISYQTLPNSVSDAKYLVFHKGGVTEFKVNQQIGGGTWVYLGTFEFEKGRNEYGMVVLSNQSKENGVVCADAVRFGGGMGNIERGGQLSGLPRYLEAARYSAQWAGMPYEVYGGRKGENDYADDLNARSRTMNYLSGGSIFNPTEEGLGVPFEMNMALHSDAGVTRGDTLIGSLGVYTTNFNDEKLHAGTNRMASRDLTDVLLSQFDRDIATNYSLSWVRRSMWDRNYSETRLPSVASTIIELLSHQNFADMRLGHDPNFKFTVGRSLYKGILKYLASQHDDSYLVQPLPVSHFAIRFGKKRNTVQLSWQAVNDPLEPTANPESYIVYTRIGRGGWDNGVEVKGNSLLTKIEPGIVYSYKITAMNRGGESFPSEILSAYKAKQERGRILIVNGFDRLSGPAVVNTPESVGFDMEAELGVPYLYDISYCGRQTNFNPEEVGKDLGVSTDEYEGMTIAGNTFNYPFIHGKAIQAAGGYSFTSCSDEALEAEHISPEDYQAIDYILGLEKYDASTAMKRTVYYKTFSSAMQRILTAYTASGGHVLVSGAYVGSDMYHQEGDRRFVHEVLKFDYSGQEQNVGEFHQIHGLDSNIRVAAMPNPLTYAVSRADRLTPADGAFAALAYSLSNASAAVAYNGNDYRTFVMGFPFESISDEALRAKIMASVLQFFFNN
ncbi:MAG: xanthan lyase [Mediterranea massiliensis]|nr:xanthan lyase [Mediterranea massiliensis]